MPLMIFFEAYLKDFAGEDCADMNCKHQNSGKTADNQV